MTRSIEGGRLLGGSRGRSKEGGGGRRGKGKSKGFQVSNKGVKFSD